MPRQPKPFFRSQTKSWYLQLGNRWISLGRDEAEAWRKYHAIMAGQQDLTPTVPVVRLLDAFLDWTHNNQAESTFVWYRDFLQSFAESVGSRLRVAELRPYHVTQWVDTKYAGTSDNYRHGAIRSVQRAFNWAAKQGVIDRSPVASVEKPTPTPRDVFVTPEQWEELLPLVNDQEFRDFIITMWETGSRPKEVRIVTARDVDNNRWVFERKKSKGKRKLRVVYLSPIARQITERLALKHPKGPIFRNTKGRPWTKNAVGLRFQRLTEKLGFRVCAYALRHGWATKKLRKGMPPLLISKLMGHADTRMLERIYEHLNDDDLQQAISS